MPYEFTLPALSEDVEEGIVVAWFKREGAEVQAGETVLEVQMAKVSFDIEAPVSGALYRILAPRDAVVKPGQAVALILQPGEAPPDTSPTSSATPAPAAGSAPAGAGAASVVASPAAKRVARERGVDLAQVRGSGEGGRISEADVLAFIEARDRPAPSASPTAIPLSGRRGTIAQRMLASLHGMAQLTLLSEVDVTALVAWREQAKADYPVSYTDLVVRAVARALRRHPPLNAWLEADAIRPQPDIHIGVAVALDDGLIAPVVRHADQKSLREIAQETRRLAEAARAGTLPPGEVTGSTFSVTNLGMYGIDGFTPIINPPEVAILGVGRIVERPARGPDGLAWRQVMTLSLTFDHRALDGAPAAQFLQTVAEELQKVDAT